MLRVAINAPLSRLFDYLPPADASIAPGSRVRVPFGHRRETGLVVECASESRIPRAKLRRATALIDDAPLLGDADLWLIRFTSDYYHHPIGEVVAAALPALLRQGRELYPLIERLASTDAGNAADLDALGKRAPRQAELLTLLRDTQAMTSAELDAAMPGWRRARKGLMEKSYVTVLHTKDDECDASLASVERQPGPELNADQATVLGAIRARQGFHTSLLDGVTGSGKTEIYLELSRECIDNGRQVLVLVPEIGLTPQLVDRFRRRLGVEPVVLHSALGDAARLAAWRKARDGSAPLVVGTRSAVFVPLASAGLIIVDEEHDSSLKQQEGLRYSARDLAVARAKHLDIPVVLGSATPSLESLQRCADAAYSHLVLPVRAGGAVPPLLRLVDLTKQHSDDGLSEPVNAAICECLAAGGQALVFLNRRGFAPTLICTNCGGVAECDRCDARMTVHARHDRLLCHHCGSSRAIDKVCAACSGTLKPLGQGTQRIEEALRARFPSHEIARIDSDSTRLRGAIDTAFARAAAGDTRILVGTQMLSKGHHFPNLTLVVVINADQGLFSTDFRGGERLAQSLIQVAGRAGREERQGEVLIQTAFPGHPFWSELLRGGYPRVAMRELAEREKAVWPPFSHLVLIRAAAHNRDDPHAFLDTARDVAAAAAAGSIRILGPVSAPMERRAGRYRAQLLLQSRERRPLHDVLRHLRGELEGNAAARRVRWSIDVDPIELF